jgi:hypothetical protein
MKRVFSGFDTIRSPTEPLQRELLMLETGYESAFKQAASSGPV